MTSLVNVNPYAPPVPIPPMAPDFVFCNGAYGTRLLRDEAFSAASRLQEGTTPVVYSVEPLGKQETGSLAVNVSSRGLQRHEYLLPFVEDFGGVSVAVDVAGPVNINRITIVPNDIRGMAAYVAGQCVGLAGWGGFVTKEIQGLVEFITDPTSDMRTPSYPDSTAFLTVTVGNHQTSHAFPGDYDPEMALMLEEAETAAVDRVQPTDRQRIADRRQYFSDAGLHMRRLETDVPWWGGWWLQENGTATADVQLANMSAKGVAVAR